MKGINSTGAPLVHVPGWVDGWVSGWVDGCKSRFKDCLQQSKSQITFFSILTKTTAVGIGLRPLSPESPRQYSSAVHLKLKS
jgi:hypothetical protein